MSTRAHRGYDVSTEKGTRWIEIEIEGGPRCDIYDEMGDLGEEDWAAIDKGIDEHEAPVEARGYARCKADVMIVVEAFRQREHNHTPDDRVGDGSVDTLDLVLGILKDNGHVGAAKRAKEESK